MPDKRKRDQNPDYFPMIEYMSEAISPELLFAAEDMLRSLPLHELFGFKTEFEERERLNREYDAVPLKATKESVQVFMVFLAVFLLISLWRESDLRLVSSTLSAVIPALIYIIGRVLTETHRLRPLILERNHEIKRQMKEITGIHQFIYQPLRLSSGQQRLFAFNKYALGTDIEKKYRLKRASAVRLALKGLKLSELDDEAVASARERLLLETEDDYYVDEKPKRREDSNR